jgi:hypothetical protein
VPPTPRTGAAEAISRGAFIVSKLRQSVVLKSCAMLAFLEYGALAMWAIFRTSEPPGAPPQLGAWFGFACMLAILSLASWSFLFLWYPALQMMQESERDEDGGVRMSRVLELFAIGCVAAVHGMLAWILLLRP